MNIIKRAMMKRHWAKQIEADKRLEVLCRQRGKEVAVLYGQRGIEYNILAEVEQILEGE